MVTLIPVLHNVNSAQRLSEVARAVYGLGYGVFVVTKAVGSAAQVGVPEVHKLAYRLGKNLLVLSDLQDAVELLQPKKVFAVMPSKYGGRDFEEAVREAFGSLGPEDRVLLVFGGAEPGLSLRELKLGEPVSLEGIEEDIGAVAIAAIALYKARALLSEKA